jgi:hypothetical protein
MIDQAQYQDLLNRINLLEASIRASKENPIRKPNSSDSIVHFVIGKEPWRDWVYYSPTAEIGAYAVRHPVNNTFWLTADGVWMRSEDRAYATWFDNKDEALAVAKVVYEREKA